MIMRFLRKVPAGMMIVPLLIGAFMNTFFPEALKIGSFTTATFSSACLLYTSQASIGAL